MKIVLATHNDGKVRELQELLAGSGLGVVSLAQYPRAPKVVEDGSTFRANALKKAREVADALGEIALADDSGLEVDYLNGAPGVISARFAGEEHNDAANNKKLLGLLAGVPQEKRSARFRCVVAIAVPGGGVETAEGTCRGFITTEPRGDCGFGYDPLFYVPEPGKTFAQLDPHEKNRLSHRGKALRNALPVLHKLAAESAKRRI